MNQSLRSVIVLGLLCLSILCGCAAAKDQEGAFALRVMTYNIHHGEGLDGKVDLPRIADLIKREGADIVGLQEVDKGMERTARRDLGAELAALTGLTCVFSNNYSIQGGEYGNAVLTRFPVKQATNTHFVKVNETEQRGLLLLVLDVRGRDLVFMVTHLDHRRDDAARWSNVGEMEALVKLHAGKPVILCGDFNDVPTSRVCRRLSETFDDTWARVGQGDGFTIPAEKPAKRIDYIWISKDGKLKPLKAWVPVSEASDHRPVVAEFELH
jgi:endonuclease/exonuclease/phosphatase family metal-dependent hydrolase